MAKESKTKVKRLVSALARESKTVTQLRKDPKALARRFRLRQDEVRALRSADFLLVVGNRLAGTTSYTFTTGSTITGRLTGGEFAIGPKTTLREFFTPRVTGKRK